MAAAKRAVPKALRAGGSPASAAASSAQIPAQAAVTPEATSWPTAKFSIAPQELLRVKMLQRNKQMRRRADAFRAALNAGLTSLGV